jgi:predicted NodU family carbamoyl transferase
MRVEGLSYYSSKTYLGSNGKLHYIDGLNLKHRSLGHFYACLTEFVGFKRLKDEGKIVGLSGHGKLWVSYIRLGKTYLK